LIKGLIVTADDFGAAPEVNAAVETAHRDGILSAASLMVAAPAAKDAVALANRLPGLRVGLHIVLVEGRPVLLPSRIPDLVDASGQFRTDMAMTGARMFFLPHVRRQLTAEITAQFEAFRATGLALDHVNAHKHFHLHPTIANTILRIGRRFGMTGLRVPREPRAVIDAVASNSPVSPPQGEGGRVRGNGGGLESLAHLFAARLARRMRGQGLLVPDRVFGLRWSGAMTRDRLLGLIGRLPDGLSEIYLHPATGSYPGSAPGYRYAEELAALTDPAVVAAASGFARGGFADFQGGKSRAA
jgi:hopanoid biosynthesis associated protein HpnK